MSFKGISKYQSYFLASKFQPKPEKQNLSYEEYRAHPSERLKHHKTKNSENVTAHGEAINIGFKVVFREFQVPQKTKEELRSLEEDSRLNRMSIDTIQAFKEFSENENCAEVMNLFRYYDIFTDLFLGAEFIPVMPLKVEFGQNNFAFYGNVMNPQTTKNQPKVSLGLNQQSKSFYWSLIMTCPDEHLTQVDGEYLHWAVSNIQHHASSNEGTLNASYLPPIPYRGTGFHRYVLLAFLHKETVDLSEFLLLKDSSDPLESRSFSSMKFYQQLQDKITPLTASFFQAQWDASVTETFHAKLGLKEPGFEWDSPPRCIPPYERFPRFADISYFEQYHPSFYTRTEKNSFISGNWDKLWNTANYRNHVADSLEKLELQRKEKVFRQDYFKDLISEEAAYEKELSEILRQYRHEEFPRRLRPMQGLLY